MFFSYFNFILLSQAYLLCFSYHLTILNLFHLILQIGFSILKRKDIRLKFVRHVVKCSMNNRRSLLAFFDLPRKISSPWVVRYFLPNIHSIVNNKSLFGYNLNQNDIWMRNFSWWYWTETSIWIKDPIYWKY